MFHIFQHHCSELRTVDVDVPGMWVNANCDDLRGYICETYKGKVLQLFLSYLKRCTVNNMDLVSTPGKYHESFMKTSRLPPEGVPTTASIPGKYPSCRRGGELLLVWSLSPEGGGIPRHPFCLIHPAKKKGVGSPDPVHHRIHSQCIME